MRLGEDEDGSTGSARADRRGESVRGGLAAQRRRRERAHDAVDVRPAARLEARTAASVSGPKMPSTLMPPSACCSSLHLPAFAAGAERDACSVVVVGSGLGCTALAAGLPAREARRSGPTVSAASAPSEIALRARARPGRSAARRRAGARASARATAPTARSSARSRGVAQAARGRRAASASDGGVVRRRGARLRTARARRARERSSEASPGVDDSKITRESRHAKASFLHLLGAYGVSCRARVSFYATPHIVAIRPRSLSAALGPPLLHPVGPRIRHERAGT